MISYDINDKHIKKDMWVKDVRKNFNPEKLAELIKRRIEFSTTTGPYVRSTDNGELPTDIIDALIASSEEYRSKLTPAIGLLLFRLLHKEIGESHELLRGMFSVIKESKLVDCRFLVQRWLDEKYETLTSNDSRWKHTYREALMAYANVQSKDEATEKWWLDLWKADNSFWWCPAFFGLRIQNPEMAASELPLLVSRNPDKMVYLLVGMWKDINTRSPLESAIREGLHTNGGWAGYALNVLLEKLDEKQKDELMIGLKGNLNG